MLDKVYLVQMVRPVISKPGYTLLPGLVNAHVHGLEGNVDCLEQSLRFGITTVCDQHNDMFSLERLSKLAKGPDKHLYADFKYAGLAAAIPGGWPEPVLAAEFKDNPKLVSCVAMRNDMADLRSSRESWMDYRA